MVEEEFLGTGQYTRKAPALSTLSSLAGPGSSLAGPGSGVAGSGSPLPGAWEYPAGELGGGLAVPQGRLAPAVSERRYAARYLMSLYRRRA